jgi:hypothetical protein
MAHTIFINMSSLFDLLALVLFIASCALLYTAHKSFTAGDVTVITSALLIAGISQLLLRLVVLFDISVFQIENTVFYRAIFALISALALFVFAVKFNDFARQLGFGRRLAKKSMADKRITKALGGE